jgi:Protein of unknown function (DUF1479)
MTLSSAKLLSSAQRIVVRYGIAQRTIASQARPAKLEGDISSVFSSLSGGRDQPLPDRYAAMKRKMIQDHEKELTDSWRRLLKRLNKENEVIAKRGSSIVPQIDFHDIEKDSKAFEDEVKLRGVAVIRGVIPEAEARSYKTEVEDYVKANPWTKGTLLNKNAILLMLMQPDFSISAS